VVHLPVAIVAALGEWLRYICLWRSLPRSTTDNGTSACGDRCRARRLTTARLPVAIAGALDD